MIPPAMDRLFPSIMSVYDEVMGKLNPSVITESFLTGGLAGMRHEGTG